VFNRRILEWLGQSIDVDVHIDESPLADLKGTVWIVDSLCLHSGAALLHRRPDVAGILIAHYLKALDPRYRTSAEARTELDALSAYHAVITTSGYSSEALRSCGYAGRIEVIYPGFDATYRRVPAERPGGQCRILTVASLLPDKGLLDLISMLEDLQDLNWSWELIGDDELDRGFASAFRDRLRSSTIAPRVTARGALQADAVLEAYDRADIFALPTRFESCSIVTMEAMARGLPVAAFRVGGLTGLLPDRFGLQLVTAGNTAGFRETLRGLISDRRLRLAYGEANRVTSERFPSWAETGAKVSDLLRAYA
jgi:glycosyltransferase involved in cell wall biosynthesis